MLANRTLHRYGYFMKCGNCKLRTVIMQRRFEYGEIRVELLVLFCYDKLKFSTNLIEIGNMQYFDFPLETDISSDGFEIWAMSRDGQGESWLLVQQLKG